MADARPLSAMQQAMLVQEALAGRPMYTMPVCFVLEGRVDADALDTALRHVLSRHPVLLSTCDGEVAVPHPGGFPGVRRVSGPRQTHESVLAELWDTLFELASEVPVRAVLLSASPDKHVLGLAVHHIAGDSWSLALLFRELGRAYEQLTNGQALAAEAAPDFFDHAAQDRREDWDTQWWQRTLRDVPPPRLPRSEPPVEDECGRFTAVSLNIDADDTRGVRASARAARLSPAAPLLAAVSATVVGEGNDSVVGLPTALRDTTERQRTVGPLLNTLPVRTAWRPGVNGTELVAAHARAVDEALAHKELPYPEILRAAGLRRGSGTDPLLTHVVNLDTVVPDLPLPGIRTVYRPIAPRWANVPALWEFSWGTVGNIRGVLRAQTDFFTASDVRELAGRFRCTLRHLVLEPR